MHFQRRQVVLLQFYLSSYILYIAWMAASLPASCPMHNLHHNFSAILRRISPISICIKPGFLSSRMSLHVKKSSSDVSLVSAFISIFLMQIFFVTLAKTFLNQWSLCHNCWKPKSSSIHQRPDLKVQNSLSFLMLHVFHNGFHQSVMTVAR